MWSLPRMTANPVRFRTNGRAIRGAQPGDEHAEILGKRRREPHPLARRRMRQRKLVRVQRMSYVPQRTALLGGEERVELASRGRRPSALGQLEEDPFVGAIQL